MDMNTTNNPNHTDTDTDTELLSMAPKDETKNEDSDVLLDFPPIIRTFKDGRVNRLVKIRWTPPTLTSDDDDDAAVLSKDVVISSETGVLARLFIPRETVLVGSDNNKIKKLHLLVYIHGGAFCIESAFSSTYNRYLTSLVAEAKVVALSVDYRLTPEHPITDCYGDTWAAIQWAVAHRNGYGPESWLTCHVNFNQVFFAGDSAGANIATNMAWRIGQGQGHGFCHHHSIKEDSSAATLVGIALVHPFFGLDDKPNSVWELYCPDSMGITDPRLNPIVHTEVLAALGCQRVLVCVAEKDEYGLCERGVSYYKALINSGWEGAAELVETPGGSHCFHLIRPAKENSRQLLKKVASFLNQAA